MVNHLILLFFENAPESGGLPSTGITRLQQYCAPLRLPPGQPPDSDFGGATPDRDGSPTLPVSLFLRAMPTTPADRNGCLHRFPSPSRAAFPVNVPGRRPQLTFRGLLRLHSRYRPQDRSTVQDGLCHRASVPPVAQRNRRSANRSNRRLSVQNPPLLGIRALVAHTFQMESKRFPRGAAIR